jgi:hypothetical protein
MGYTACPVPVEIATRFFTHRGRGTYDNGAIGWEHWVTPHQCNDSITLSVTAISLTFSLAAPASSGNFDLPRRYRQRQTLVRSDFEAQFYRLGNVVQRLGPRRALALGSRNQG